MLDGYLALAMKMDFTRKNQFLNYMMEYIMQENLQKQSFLGKGTRMQINKTAWTALFESEEEVQSIANKVS